MPPGGFAQFWKTYSIPGQRASQEKRAQEKWEEEKKELSRDEEWRKGRDEIRARYTSEPIFTQADDGDVPVQVGTRPKKLSPADSMRMVEDVAAHDFAHGKLGANGWQQAGDTVRRMKAEGMLDAHRAFVESGDIRKAADVFNSVGKRRVDVASLRAEEVEHPAFGKYLTYRGTYEDGEPFTYDPIKTSVLAGGARAFLESQKDEATAGRQRDALEIRGEEVARKAERDAAEDSRRSRELDIRERELTARRTSAPERKTALQRNVDYLVANGVAKDHTDAFSRLREALKKPEADAVVAITRDLSRSPRFMGKDGTERATTEAKRIVRESRADDAPAGYRSAEDVRSAFRSGKISRAQAVKELRGFGYE